MAADLSDVVADLAEEFINLAMRFNPAWTRAFYRYTHEGSRLGSNASCVANGVANLVDPFAHAAAFRKLNEIAERLFQAIGKDKAVILLIVDNNFDFDVKFEYTNMHKWSISKLDGASGIPEGF